MAIRYHLDEHVHPAVAVGLVAQGIDVTTSVEAGLLGRDDPEQIAFALGEERVLVTHDNDLLRHHAEGIEHAGIAYCHQQKYTTSQLLQMLRLLAECYAADEMAGRVEFL